MATTYSSTLKQPLLLPAEDVVLSFLKQEALTEDLDPIILEKVAKTFANQTFIRDTSLKALNLPIKLLDLMDLDYALECCAKRKPPMISLVPKGSAFPKKVETEDSSPVFNSSTRDLDNFLESLREKCKLEETTFKKHESQALLEAAEGKLGDCLKTIKGIEDYSFRNKVCLSVARFFAQKGDFSSVRLVVWEIESHHGTLAAAREQNDAFSELTLVFANHGFIKEAKQSIDAISSDYSKYDDSEFSTDLIGRTYTHFIEELIRQKKFQDADQLLWHVRKKDSYRLGKQIKIGLGSWQEPKSVSSNRYWSSDLHKELTIEELTIEKVKIYAEKRAYEEIDVSDRPKGDDFDFNSGMWEWKARKREEVERLRKKRFEEFNHLLVDEQCNLLQKYIKIDKFEFTAELELKNVMGYLRGRQ